MGVAVVVVTHPAYIANVVVAFLFDDRHSKPEARQRVDVPKLGAWIGRVLAAASPHVAAVVNALIAAPSSCTSWGDDTCACTSDIQAAWNVVKTAAAAQRQERRDCARESHDTRVQKQS